MGEAIDKDYLSLIVSNLIDGMSLSRVPTQYLEYLFEPLASEKEIAMASGRTQTVIRIQNIVKEINSITSPNYHDSPRSVRSQRSSNSSRSSIPIKKKQKPKEDTSQLKETSEYDMSHIPTPTSLQDIISVLEVDKNRAVSARDYHQAQKIYNIIHDIKVQLYQSPQKISNSGNYLNIERKIADFEDDLQDTIDYYDEQRKLMLQFKADAEKELKEIHEQQISDFKETWPKILPAPFRKVSKRVLEIRDQERHLIYMNRYDDAIEYKNRADRLEKRDIDRQRDNFNDQFRRNLKTLRDAQKKELLALSAKWASKLDELNAHAKKDIENKKRNIELLKSKLLLDDASRFRLSDYEGKSSVRSPLSQRNPWKP
ncbi:hypothetical protein TVAG_397300 [Trichomonas vaginalis G3]|uniref:Uncharacterized protein n=1 Tax=Trichomonas vaginalis (strain ATCC PRA-98 / G3) TaxID=412133 RepID=A2DXB7_TRIV3|nr:hypothetical protein TVAGG3_0672780 [Trichomonas vaginalis G3]EAY14999.1 hypothetical protein TVAG_397300 [Trichomonas vaginalis G3]KAI5507321.1 hypothetical protein TVAGG3_0672780 [Trichomonas vaginalis G3]|eukprot:XP_001327222.1 hypothetical protein [Trichomonas vaginalis G3]